MEGNGTMIVRTDVSFLLRVYNLIGDNNYEGKMQCGKCCDKKYHGYLHFIPSQFTPVTEPARFLGPLSLFDYYEC